MGIQDYLNYLDQKQVDENISNICAKMRAEDIQKEINRMLNN